MSRKSVIWIVAVIIIAGLVLLGISRSGGDRDKGKKGDKDKLQRKVSAYVAGPSQLVDEIAVSGSLLAFDEVELRNEVTGRVVQLYLPEGKPVKKGMLLVKLFDDDLQAGLKKLEAQLSVKKQIYQRQGELLKVNGISRNDYDETGLEVQTILADIDAEKAAIRKTEVRAPFDGVIGLKNISIGAVIPSSSLLATIRTSNKIKLDFSVPERYSPVVRPGLKIDFITGDGNNQYEATVFATEKGIDPTTRSLKVRALVDGGSPELLSGAYANVTVRLRETKNALLIPTSAIIPQEDRKTVIVARGGKAHFTEIQTGIRQSSNIEVIKGIQFGDTIIINGLQFLKKDAKLNYLTVNSTL